MVTSIHVHTEIKVKGEWHHYSFARLKRSYRLFTKMAGVFEIKGIEPIALPKGLPKDISIVTKISRQRYGEGDAIHGDSWLNAREIAEIEKWYNTITDSDFDSSEQLGWCFHCSFGEFIEYPNNFPKEIEDLRWVFWFDN